MRVPLSDFGNLDPSCPWSELIRTHPPNVKWCEASLCGWIREPANTWSNLAYILLGLYMLLLSRRHGRLTAVFGAAAIAVGISSFVYHASTNFLTQMLDFAGMYIFSCLPLLLNLHRLGLVKKQVPIAAYVLMVVVLTALTPLVHAAGLPIQGMVLLLVLCIIGTELVLAQRRRAPVTRRFFFVSLLLMTLGAVSSGLDVSRAACDPQSHLLQGHAVWHLLTALSLVALCRFYRDTLTAV